MSEGMSAERLAGIHKTARRGDQHLVVLGDCDTECAACAVDELLAEVERLRAHLAAEHLAAEAAEAENDQLRARLNGTGEMRDEWGVRTSSATWPATSEHVAEGYAATYHAQGREGQKVRRLIGAWREVPNA